MNNLVLNEVTLVWALVLPIIFPILVVMLGELSHVLEARNNPFASALQSARNFVLPSLVVLLLLQYVIGLESTHFAWQSVATVFWIFALHTTLSVLNAVVFAFANDRSWRSHVPPLLIDMIRYFLVALGAAIVLASVWGIDLTGLMAALGVGSLVIGLALQETLGNMFSGIALLFERPMRVGDWVEIDGQTGRVINFNSRAVNLENVDHELMVIPNRTFAQQRFRNLSHNNTFGYCLSFGFSYNDPPNSVKSLLIRVARETRRILNEPQPVCRLQSYDGQEVRYEIRLFVSDYAELARICDEYTTRLWYSARRHGLSMRPELEPVEPEHHSEDEVLQHLQSMPMLASVQRSVLQSLAKGIKIQNFGKSEQIIRQGEPGKALYIILQGQAIVTCDDDAGSEREIARLRRGEYFGELALFSNEVSHASVTAVEDLEVIAIYPGPVREIVDNNPQLARELNATMARRSKSTGIQ